MSTNAERLRTRLMVAAQKFANEVADAVLEATGGEEAEEQRPQRRRAPRRPPVAVADVEPKAAERAEAALAQIGIRR